MILKDVKSGIFDLGAKNVDISKLPIIIKDKVLMAPGVWNDASYSDEEIQKAFLNMDWTDKDSIGIIADHSSSQEGENANAGLSVHDWFGFVRNVRLDQTGEISNVPGSIIGDLEIHDSQIAQKLVNAEAKFGISPRIYGEELTPGVITDFSFKHFAIVTSPAISKAYINLSKKEDLSRGEGKGVDGPEQGDGGATKCVCPKCGNSINHEKGEPCSDVKCPKCGTMMGGESKDMESQLPEKGKTSLKGGIKNMQEKEKTIEKEVKEEVKEDLSIKVDKLSEQVSALTSLVEKTITKDMKSEEAEEPEAEAEEEPEAEEKPAEEESEEKAEESDAVKDMAKKLEETTAKLKDLEKQMNEPEKAIISKDLAVNPMCSGYSTGDQQMAGFLRDNYA